MSDAIHRLNAALQGRYRVEREIGEGGMATVYLADDLKHERKVALKVLKPELAAVVGAKRFLAEIKTTANLQHPNILPLHDSGEADGFLFYVMPYVEGESLRDRIDRERQLPVEEAVRIATELAEALHAAHEEGVIHRDIKPANVLLSRGRPLVADFGIALAVSAAGGGRMTETGLSLGTPHYMSPEQATGDLAVGPKADIYSLGCVLYEMLVGEPPYTGGTAQAILAKIITADTPEATQIRSSIPPHVDATIRKALEKLSADRFASAPEFANALQSRDFRHGESTEAGTLDAGIWKPLFLATSGLAIVLAAALGWSLLRPAPTSEVTRWEVALPEGLTTANLLPWVELALSPDGTEYVFLGDSADGERQLWLRPFDQLEPVPIRGTEDATNPRFSPDGEEIAFITLGDRTDLENGALKIAPMSGASPRTVVSDSVAFWTGLAWGSDGMLYFGKADSGIWRVSPDGGRAEQVTTEGNVELAWPEALPNGRGLLVTRLHGGPLEDSIAVLSFETGEIKTLLQGAMARYSASGHLVYASGEGSLMGVPFDLDRMELDGPSRPLLEGVQVRRSSASQFTLSASGALAYRPGSVLMSGVGSSPAFVPMWIADDGSYEPLNANLTGQFEAPAISPDGGRIAFEHTPTGGVEDIWVYTIAQGTLIRLTFGEGSARRPFWSPDGREIGFISDRDEEQAVYSIAADGSESTARLVVELPGVQEALWTPDGRRMVLRVGNLDLVDEADLYVSAAHPDSAAAILFDMPFKVHSPALSPDGRWLAYTSEESGRWEVYVRSFPGPGGRRLVSDAGGQDPVWAPDGGALLYAKLDGPVVVTTVRSEPDFSVVSREAHPEWPALWAPNTTQHFDISPLDGRVLGLVPLGWDTEERDVVVQNFFEELKRLVPN